MSRLFPGEPLTIWAHGRGTIRSALTLIASHVVAGTAFSRILAVPLIFHLRVLGRVFVIALAVRLWSSRFCISHIHTLPHVRGTR